MTDLIERLEASEGADRELDVEISKLFSQEHGEREYVCIETRTIEHYPEVAARYTASLDAALALVEAVLDFEKLPQGSQLLIERFADFNLGTGKYDFEWLVRILVFRHRHEGSTEFATARHKSAPIALLLALLKASNTESEG